MPTLTQKIKGLEYYLTHARNYKKVWIEEIKNKSTSLNNYYDLLEEEEDQCMQAAYEAIGEARCGA